MTAYDVFRTRTGRTVVTVRGALFARFTRWVWGTGYDYVETGSGWCHAGAEWHA